MSGSLATGESVELLEVTGERVLLRSPRAFAPGAPIRFERLGEEVSLEGRSLGSRRDGDGFLVRCRLVSLRREQREGLVAFAGAGRATS